MGMHKTKSGRWQPDPPPKEPAPPQMAPLTYDVYLHHTYVHDAVVESCPFCQPPPPPEPPWDLLNSITLRKP